jgi:hypothetical protein
VPTLPAQGGPDGRCLVTAVWIAVGVLAAAAYIAFACWVGRLLRRQQPHNHPPKGGNHS